MRRRLAPFLLLAFLLLAGAPELQARGGGGSEPPVVLLKDGDFVRQLLQDIRTARKSIRCTYFLFKTGDRSGNLPRQVAEELVRASRRGVDVTVTLEQSRNEGDDLNRDNRRTAALLRRGGVRVLFDPPGVTTHVKAAVFDGRTVILGSHNLTQSALRHNNELSVRIDSPSLAAEIGAYQDRL
jgi:phosphatidylserine/phosphatidylglycerophosphate/cardiolipin synthase-like enzyme